MTCRVKVTIVGQNIFRSIIFVSWVRRDVSFAQVHVYIRWIRVLLSIVKMPTLYVVYPFYLGIGLNSWLVRLSLILREKPISIILVCGEYIYGVYFLRISKYFIHVRCHISLIPFYVVRQIMLTGIIPKVFWMQLATNFDRNYNL